jgi:hypothetical protein
VIRQVNTIGATLLEGFRTLLELVGALPVEAEALRSARVPALATVTRIRGEMDAAFSTPVETVRAQADFILAHLVELALVLLVARFHAQPVVTGFVSLAGLPAAATMLRVGVEVDAFLLAQDPIFGTGVFVTEPLRISPVLVLAIVVVLVELLRDRVFDEATAQRGRCSEDDR